MKCPLCASEFTDKEVIPVCGTCPLVRKCPLVRCPNCNYEWPREQHTNIGYISLINIPVGNKRDIISICSADLDILKKVIALGIMPGNSIRLLRKSPAIVCQIDYAQITIDETIAKMVLVRV